MLTRSISLKLYDFLVLYLIIGAFYYGIKVDRGFMYFGRSLGDVLLWPVSAPLSMGWYQRPIQAANLLAVIDMAKQLTPYELGETCREFREEGAPHPRHISSVCFRHVYKLDADILNSIHAGMGEWTKTTLQSYLLNMQKRCSAPIFDNDDRMRRVIESMKDPQRSPEIHQGMREAFITLVEGKEMSITVPEGYREALLEAASPREHRAFIEVLANQAHQLSRHEKLQVADKVMKE